jgi:hypothetical protein
VLEKKDKIAGEEFTGVLQIKEGAANAALVSEELKLYDGKWDWKVRQCDQDKFSLVFPCKSLEQHFTRLKGFEFNNVAVKASITASDQQGLHPN